MSVWRLKKIKKINSLIEHYLLKEEVLKDIIYRLGEENTTFSSVIVCAMCYQEKMIIKTFIKELKSLLE